MNFSSRSCGVAACLASCMAEAILSSVVDITSKKSIPACPSGSLCLSLLSRPISCLIVVDSARASVSPRSACSLKSAFGHRRTVAGVTESSVRSLTSADGDDSTISCAGGLAFEFRRGKSLMRDTAKRRPTASVRQFRQAPLRRCRTASKRRSRVCHSPRSMVVCAILN